MAEVFGTIGSDIVELNNAATETSLKELIRVIQNQTRTLGGAGGGAGAGTGAAGAAAAQASQNLTQLSNTTRNSNTSISEWSTALTASKKALLEFSKTLLDGTAQASGLFNAFTNLPGVIG